jgi:protein-S-isoprenylcysteine O-methyltransferase Ste14
VIVRLWLFVKVVLFLLLLPGTVLVYVPRIIVHRSGLSGIPVFSAVSALSFIAWIIGVTILLACVWDFAVHGKGTLAPVDPPSVLVVRRLYRFTRNPMYLGPTMNAIAAQFPAGGSHSGRFDN